MTKYEKPFQYRLFGSSPEETDQMNSNLPICESAKLKPKS